ncbi:MAG: TetR/AcrR family transcriptional regulator [Hyphomonadaceae bacterium]|nr:TetR/AcrR family transcriptional regulator [Hyphomonadaceae bacterium]
MQDSLNPADLLVQAALEGLLNRTAGRNDSAARLERVKAAALMECAEKGYAALTVNGIARRAKVSTASIYAAFEDRDALLVAAMEMMFAILAEDEIVIPDHPDPQQRVEQLLVAHGLVYLQPLTLWTFRLHMMLVWSGHAHLQEIGQRVFQGIDAFWRGFLGDLVAGGHLVGLDVETVVPWLLAPVERATILARLTCGELEPPGPSYIDVARHGARALFELWGTRAGAAGQDMAARHVSGSMKPGHGTTSAFVGNSTDRLLETPSVRLQTLLANSPHRLVASARRDRIILAAAAVCHAKGYDAASMQDVALLARVSTASIYKEFEDKAELFACALEAEFLYRAELAGEADPAGITSNGALFTLLARLAKSDTDPDRAWVSSIMMASEISGTPRVALMARADRQERERKVQEQVLAMPESKGLDRLTIDLVVNQMLGPVERVGLLSLLLFGRGALDPDALAGLADFTVRNHQRLLEVRAVL